MFALTSALVVNAFANLSHRIAAHDRPIAMRFCMRLINLGHTFPSASEAIGFVSSELWNSGYVGNPKPMSRQEWIDGWEAEYAEGKTRISRDEAESRFEKYLEKFIA